MELKARTARSIADEEEMLELGADCPIEPTQVYIKSEADKVIAEKDKEIEELKEQVHDYAQGLYVMQARAEKEARHDKFKRCFAMSKWCETRHFIIRYIQADKILNDENYIGTFDYIRREYMIKHYCRWANKWLELAEKLKEAK